MLAGTLQRHGAQEKHHAASRARSDTSITMLALAHSNARARRRQRRREHEQISAHMAQKEQRHTSRRKSKYEGPTPAAMRPSAMAASWALRSITLGGALLER